MINNHISISDDELYHYGVKGMKWGIRREARVVANVAAHTVLAKVAFDGGGMARKALMKSGDKRLKRVGNLVNVGAKAASIAITVVGLLKVKEMIQDDEPGGNA